MDSIQAMYIGRFIGPNKIEDIIASDQRTPSGSVVFEVTLDSGKVMPMPEKGLAAVISDEKKDYNHIRDARVSAMLGQLVNTIEEYDLPASDIEHMVRMLAFTLDLRFARALNFMWTKDDKRFVPGFGPENEATILMAERVISTIPHEPGPEQA